MKHSEPEPSGIVEPVFGALMVIAAVGGLVGAYNIGVRNGRADLCDELKSVIVEGRCVRRDSLKAVGP